MAIAIGKKSASTAPKTETVAETAKPATIQTAAPAAKAPQPASFLKTGKAAVEAFSTAEAQAEAAKNGLWRFMLTKKQLGQPHKIVFLDGGLDEEGMLGNPMFWEYTVYHAGKWQNFVKPNDDEGPDPIAMDGNKASLVQVFTILNLTPFERKDGTIVEAHKQLFICKRNTMKRLAQYAKKRDGLAGCVFEVTRTNEKSENVGDMFDFEQKVTMEELVNQFGVELATPANYGEVIQYRGVDELKKLGFGSGQGSIKAGGVSDGVDYSDQL